MKIGHIYLATSSDDDARQFTSLIEAFDRLAIEQHVLVASAALARKFDSCSYVTVGPVVRTAVMAYCLMPSVDLVHIHDDKSEQAGLLFRLTRSIPFVMAAGDTSDSDLNPLTRAARQRAASLMRQSYDEHDEILASYRQAIDTWSKFPQDADCG